MTVQRYSPRPLAEYREDVSLQQIGAPDSAIVVGPAGSALLRGDTEAWNLAYLSHDFDTQLMYPDPQFTTHVRRTTQFVISSGSLDLAEEVPDRAKVRSLLRLPPLAAARAIVALPRVKQLPLYQAYGQGWLDTLMRRASQRTSAGDPDNDVASVSDAATYLLRFKGATP
jgi:hypothetical protein